MRARADGRELEREIHGSNLEEGGAERLSRLLQIEREGRPMIDLVLIVLDASSKEPVPAVQPDKVPVLHHQFRSTGEELAVVQNADACPLQGFHEGYEFFKLLFLKAAGSVNQLLLNTDNYILLTDNRFFDLFCGVTVSVMDGLYNYRV